MAAERFWPEAATPPLFAFVEGDRPSGLCGTDWDLAPDGKRVAVVIPEGSAQALQEHVIVMLQNFADELRRRFLINTVLDPGELPFNVIRYTLGA